MEASASPSRLHSLGPGIVAALSFAIGDVFSKVALVDGADVLTLSVFRSVFSVVVLYVWIMLKPPSVPHTPRQRWVSLGVGLLFAGIVFSLFKAIELAQVQVAILSYFIYPLTTGIVGAAIGIDKCGWRGAAAALVAFCGLALIVGAQPGHIALVGIGFAVGAAGLRTVVLLVTRAMLAGADARLITWYSMLSSTAVFVIAALATLHWQGPHTAYGWTAMSIVGVMITVAVFALYVSIDRIGPFRSALIMNLEPLTASILAVPLVGDIITPLQGLGGVIMLGALVAFQLRR